MKKYDTHSMEEMEIAVSATRNQLQEKKKGEE